MNRYERQIKGIEEAQLRHAKAISDLYDLERKEDRALNDDERLTVEEHVKAVEVLKIEKREAEANVKTLTEAEDLGRKLGPAVPSMSVNSEPQDRVFHSMQKTLGEAFIESKGYKDAIDQYREAGRFPSNFSTGRSPWRRRAPCWRARAAAAAVSPRPSRRSSRASSTSCSSG